MSMVMAGSGPPLQDDVAGRAKRQQREAEFHDQWSESLNEQRIAVHEAFESPTATENRHVLREFGSLSGKRILDLGCGMGDAAVFFALRGATVCAVDVSPGMVDVTTRLARWHEVADRVVATVMPAEDLRYEDESFDLVYGNGVLHHVDFLTAGREAHRVLRPGGRAAFIEPLTYNPIIWAYRTMARRVRSTDERPLSARDIRRLIGAKGAAGEPQWARGSHTEFHLTTPLIMVWFLVGEGISPSRERYWKRFIEQGPRHERLFSSARVR